MGEQGARCTARRFLAIKNDPKGPTGYTPIFPNRKNGSLTRPTGRLLLALRLVWLTGWSPLAPSRTFGFIFYL